MPDGHRVNLFAPGSDQFMTRHQRSNDMATFNLSKFVLAAAISAIGVTATANSALAGKEVFVRTKVHVNFSTIGRTKVRPREPANAAMLIPAVQAARDYTPPPPPQQSPQPPSSPSQDDCMSCD